MRILTLAVGITILIVIKGCTVPEIVYVEQVLPLPPRLEERLTNEELSCVSEDTYNKIVRLDKRRLTLRRIIESTSK